LLGYSCVPVPSSLRPVVLTVSSVCQQLVYGGFIAVMGGLFLFGQSGSSGEAAGANVRSIAYPGPEPGC